MLPEENWKEDDKDFARLLVWIHIDGQGSGQLAGPATIASRGAI
jgi:hypothetical protein